MYTSIPSRKWFLYTSRRASFAGNPQFSPTAASHTKDTYLGAQFRQIAKRRGKKRAIIAVARTILVMAYYILGRDQEYRELGGDYFDRLHPERLRQYYVRRLQKLGYAVQLSNPAEAA